MAVLALAGSKKGAAREARTIVWVDESGFALLPAVMRSLAPRGHPPTLSQRVRSRRVGDRFR